ncbi:MAG: hypothetical protein HY713_08385 [candidate division NC10 bacterium]|nr:hypothetical protein [candidate division NC10 bacterium]
MSRSEGPRRALALATPEQDRLSAGARWVIRKAEVALERQRGTRRASQPQGWQRLRRASLYLAAARWKLAREDWQGAMLLASKAEDVALGSAGSGPNTH